MSGVRSKIPVHNVYYLLSYAWNRLAHIPRLQQNTRIVFVALDNENLPAAQLKRFIEFYNPDFTALSGSNTNLEYLVDQLGLTGETSFNQIYCDDRTTVVGLVDPRGYLVARFVGISDPRIIARDLEFLADQH